MAGLWKCTLKVDGGAAPDQQGELDLKQDGKDLRGTGTSAGGSAPIKGTFDDPSYKIIVQAGDSEWNLDGKLAKGRLVGTWAIPAMQVKGTMECGQGMGDSPLTGLWNCVTKGDQPGEFKLDLVVKGEEVSGTGSNAQGTAPLKGTFKEGKFAFKIDAGDTQFELEGKLEEGKISGTLNIPAAQIKVPFEGKK